MNGSLKTTQETTAGDWARSGRSEDNDGIGRDCNTGEVVTFVYVLETE